MSPSSIALVTGANSGLGFETAALLAERGFDTVVLACRTLDKAEDARARLVERVGRDPFESLELPLGDHKRVRAAAKTLADRGHAIDTLILNAGLMGDSTVRRNVSGVEIAAGASLVGHHLFTVLLLEAGGLSADARIVIAGSEAARGDVPGMKLLDLHRHAADHTAGDLAVTIQQVSRAEAPYVYKNMSHYAVVKLFVAWWAAALAERLPEGMTVSAVSPGSVPTTDAFRNQPWFMRVVMKHVLARIAPYVGWGDSLAAGAGRYLEIADRGVQGNGSFFASAPGKMVGAMTRQEQDHVLDPRGVQAVWLAMAGLTGASYGAESVVPLREVG